MVLNIFLIFSKLKRVAFHVKVEIDDRGGWNVFEELLPPLDLEEGSDVDEDSYIYSHYKLELHRDGVLFWEVTKSDFFQENSVFKRTGDVHIPELEGGVTDWLSLNPGVDTIRLVLAPEGEKQDDYIDEDIP